MLSEVQISDKITQNVWHKISLFMYLCISVLIHCWVQNPLGRGCHKQIHSKQTNIHQNQDETLPYVNPTSVSLWIRDTDAAQVRHEQGWVLPNAMFCFAEHLGFPFHGCIWNEIIVQIYQRRPMIVYIWNEVTKIETVQPNAANISIKDTGQRSCKEKLHIQHHGSQECDKHEAALCLCGQNRTWDFRCAVCFIAEHRDGSGFMQMDVGKSLDRSMCLLGRVLINLVGC